MQEHDTAQNASRTTISALALEAAQSGFAVFPLRGKVPAIGKRDGGNGYKDASRDRSRVTAMFNASPDATGYGIATGQRSGIVVVDVDGPEGRAEAVRVGLTSGYVVKTGREDGDGWHIYLSIPTGTQVKSRTLAPKLELKADGHYVAGPGSMHPSGRTYRIVKDGGPSAAPEWIMHPEPQPERDGKRRTDAGPVSIDTAGPEIPNGERNRTLARICGRLHDGTRSLADLERDLDAINAGRCAPPLDAGEVRRIAASIHRREPCRGRPVASERVRAMVDHLRTLAASRPVRGKGGASGWAIYHGGLDLALEHGREHPDGFTLAVDRRTWGQRAACDNGTVSRWIKRSPLVEVLDRGSGRRSSTVLFRVPIGGELHHSTTLRDSQETTTVRSDAIDPLFRNLYRSRWTEPERRARRGVTPGTRRVRQSITPRREGRERLGKSRSNLLDLIRRNPDARRAEIARLKGVKPESLNKPLRWLIAAGLIVRTSRGRYAPVPDLAQRVADARELAGEPEADRLQITKDRLARARYRHRQTGEAQPTPPESEAAYQQSRERGERERVKSANAAQPERTRAEQGAPWQRVRQMQREGMSYRHAVTSVFGADSPECASARAECERRRERAGVQAERVRTGGAA